MFWGAFSADNVYFILFIKYLGQIIQPATDANFQDVVLKIVVRKQFGNVSLHDLYQVSAMKQQVESESL